MLNDIHFSQVSLLFRTHLSFIIYCLACKPCCLFPLNTCDSHILCAYSSIFKLTPPNTHTHIHTKKNVSLIFPNEWCTDARGIIKLAEFRVRGLRHQPAEYRCICYASSTRLSQSLVSIVSCVLYQHGSSWSVSRLFLFASVNSLKYLNLISCQQQVVNIFGPVLHHSGQLPVLAVQILLSSLHVFLTLLSLTSHHPGPASAPYTAPGAPLQSP